MQKQVVVSMCCAACMQKYRLVPTGWEELPTWPFADFVFNQPSDWFQNCNKLKQAGFNGMKVDTDQVRQHPHQPHCHVERKDYTVRSSFLLA